VSPWNTQGGIQADGVDAEATADATVTMNTPNTAYAVSVTRSVQAWASGTSGNYGWTILPTSEDGLRVASAEAATASYRPLLSVIYDPPRTATFQQGVDGYTGTVDTYIGTGRGNQATSPALIIDGPDVQSLLRFDGIFGPATNQIPTGSTIVSATLTLRVGSDPNDPSTTPVNLHRLLHPWLDTDLWAAYGVSPWNTQGGIQADGVDAEATADATVTMNTPNTAYAVSVTRSVQAWASGTSNNYGWTVLPTSMDGLRVASAEATTASYRPRLSVTYNLPPPQEVVGVMLEGNSPTTLIWESQEAVAVYDLLTGDLTGLLADDGVSSGTCLASDVPTAQFVDTRAGPPGADGYYYLVRAANARGTGSYGYSSSGSERIPLLDCP
jgi:hypothetical protein